MPADNQDSTAEGEDVLPNPWWSVPDQEFWPERKEIGYWVFALAVGAWMGQQYYSSILNGVILMASAFPVLHFGWFYTIEIGQNPDIKNGRAVAIWVAAIFIVLNSTILTDTDTQFALLTAASWLGLTGLLFTVDFLGYYPGPLGSEPGGSDG